MVKDHFRAKSILTGVVDEIELRKVYFFPKSSDLIPKSHNRVKGHLCDEYLSFFTISNVMMLSFPCSVFLGIP